MRTVLGIFLAVLSSMAADGCKRAASSAVTPQKLSECSARMSVVFPQSARPIRISESHGMDDAIFLKVEINRNDLARFIQGSPFAGMVLRTDRHRLSPRKRLSWWDVDSIANFQSGEVQLPDASYLRILIGLDKPTKAMLYLEWFET